MKWCLITKDDICFINLNKLRDNVLINSYDDCLKFIHKKNPAKGKLSSITLKGPYASNNMLKWIVYYEMPVNKNHVDSQWKLCSPDKTITAFNGAVLIYTKSQLSDEKKRLYPNIRETIDIDIDSAVDWKLSTLEKRLLQDESNESDIDEASNESDIEENEEDEEEDEREEEEDRVDTIVKDLSQIDNCSDDLENSNYKDEELLFEDDNVKVDISLSKNVNLTEDDTNGLKYESYTYEAKYIPF